MKIKTLCVNLIHTCFAKCWNTMSKNNFQAEDTLGVHGVQNRRSSVGGASLRLRLSYVSAQFLVFV